MKIIFTGLLLLVLTGFAIENKIRIVDLPNDLVLWNSDVKLKWDDFQGKPDEKSSYKAMTYTKIKSYKNQYSDSVVDYDFKCFFERKTSWKKIQTQDLLRHEQLHFDIAELVTRQLRKEFLEHKFVSLDSINPMINRIFQKAVLTRRNLNKEFDTETNHGLIKDKQKEWEEKVAKELKALDKYSSTRVVIRRIKNRH